MPPPATPPKPTAIFTENTFQPLTPKEKVSIAGVQIDRDLVERAGFLKLAAERSTSSAPPTSPISEAFRTLAYDITTPGPSPTTRTSPYASTFASQQQSGPSTPTRPSAGSAGAGACAGTSPVMQGSPSEVTPTKLPLSPKRSPSSHHMSPEPSKRPKPRARRSELAPVQIPDAPMASPPPFPGGAVTVGILGQEVEPKMGVEREGEGKEREVGGEEEEEMRAEQERKDSLLRKPSVAGYVSKRGKGE